MLKLNNDVKIGILEGIISSTRNFIDDESSNYGSLSELKSNYSIAKSLYDFLIGQSNKLPTYKTLDTTIKNYPFEYISIACGLGLKTDEVNHLVIEITDPIPDHRLERTDIITSDDHIIFISPEVNLNSLAVPTNERTIQYVDSSTDTKYDIKRIIALQNYLNGYINAYGNTLNRTKKL